MTHPWRTGREPRSRPPIVDVVLGVPNPERHRRILIAILVAAGAHGALWLWAQRSERSLESLSAEMAARVHAELSRDEYVEMAKPPTPPPPEEKPKIEEPLKQPAPPKVQVGARSRAESSKPPPPAQAGAIIAQEPSPNTPVDLTGATFVTGTANAYAGGVTASTGTKTVAVQTREVDPRSAPGAHAADHSRTVSLEDQNWSCPWPREADAEQIDEQMVVIRVVVRVDGNAESAEVLSDPGHGFGQAAAACAMRTRFSPARGRDGDPVRSKSPPIRVRFTR